ncbi:hypothetical protein ACIBK9_49920 [Nonomuraea sp. NPDC050227]|uniref:hypothetical protein n=1 Tax=Nonomuraea sp. NPDC050227 TaxID=3364360 RepID=UPI0037A1AC9A
MKRLLSVIALAGAAITLVAPSSPASATPVSVAALPNCWGGTDGGHRGQMWCNGAAGHVRLITHCWAPVPWADSGWMWKNEGNFYYENTCWNNAESVETLRSS